MPLTTLKENSKDGRRARTRGRLLAAAEIVLSQRHVDGVTIDELVREAAVGRGSFYNHFKSTDELAQAVAADIRNEIDARVQYGNAGITDPALRLARATCLGIQYALAHQERSRLWLNHGIPSPDPRARDNFGLVRDLRAGRQAHVFRVAHDAIAVTVTVGVITAAMRFALASPKAVTVAYATGVSAALLEALGVEPAQAREHGRLAARDLLGRPFPGSASCATAQNTTLRTP